MAKNGTIYASGSYYYTDPIPVKEGDVIRLYTYRDRAFIIRMMRFVCAYNSSGQAVSASGAEEVSAYTVPTGIDSVVLTSYGRPGNINQLMVTKNYEATKYEAYFQPYYIASEEFVEEILNEYVPPMSTVDGHNLIKNAEDGIGAYYANGSTLKYDPSYTSYHYAIMPVEKNSRYYVSRNPRWWVLTDDNDIILSSGTGFSSTNKRFIDTGNATKFYFTIDKGSWEAEATYGSRFGIIIAKSDVGSGSLTGQQKPKQIMGLTQRTSENKYAFAVPRISPRFTVGFNQKWYYKNALALDSNFSTINAGECGNLLPDGVEFTITTPRTTGYYCLVYDQNLALVEQQSQIDLIAKAENLSNCSALVIGDSTVAQNKMTETMLNTFTERNKTLTLLGTQGTSPNNHEGRSGWSAKQYCTQPSSNPFYNNGFDFSHYMTTQGYASVDFVVIQLGINDLYNANFEKSDAVINETLGYLCTIIDSILTWNASQKIIINLPTPVNPNWTGKNMTFIRNIFVRYNARALIELTKYSSNNVRPSHCHLILDPYNDISDNVHPKKAGYEKMGLEVVSQINCYQNS